MSFFKKNKYFLVCCILVAGLVLLSVYEPRSRIPTPEFPTITTSGGRTYDLAKYPHISNEIIGLYNYFREVLFSQGVDSFDNIEPSLAGLPVTFGPGADTGLRYVLSFLAYAMSEMIATTPGYRDPQYYQNTSDWVIQKMESPRVMEYWNVSGQMAYDGKSFYQYTIDHYPGVPLGDYYGLNYTNIMYRGHWVLMQALYQYLFNDPKYNFTLTQQCDMLFDEMTNNSHPTHTTPGVTCEPVQLFTQCNSIQSLAFKIYDEALNTSRSNYYSAAARFLEWSLENMTADGLFVNGINVTKFVAGNPNHVHDYDSGYTNAWTIAFINAYNQSIAQTLYDKYKPVYVKNHTYPGIIGEFEFVLEDAYAAPYSTDIMEFAWSIVANGFGIMCAKEMGDTKSLNNIMNWIESLFPPKWKSNTFYYPTPLFEGLQFVANAILYWGMQQDWVTLGNFTQRRAPSFWNNQTYIVDVSDIENIFINQAYYDETKTAFLLTCSAAVPGTIKLTNAENGTVYSAQTSGFTPQYNVENITISIEDPGSYNFVIEF